MWGSMVGALVAIVLDSLTASCGARSPLLSASERDAGSEAGSDASVPSVDAGLDGAPGVDAAPDGGVDANDAAPSPTCTDEDPATWEVEHYRDDGDYDRAVAATSGVPWVALNVSGGNVVVKQLGVDATGILVQEAFEIPDSPVYPLALDVNDAYFALATASGVNWNGDLELWLVNRADGSVLRAPVGQPPADPAYTANVVLGLVGNDVVIAYGRLIDDLGTLEIRDTALAVQSTLPLDDSHVQAVHRSPDALDIYVGATAVVHVAPGATTTEPVDPQWQLLGGLSDYLVQYGNEIRMVRGDDEWLGPWPHTQISPPAVLRLNGDRGVFSLNTELTGVVGYAWGGALAWLRIESSPEASGIGVALMPVNQERRVGLFYLGLEIPHPEQPLRYFGRVCRDNQGL